MSAATLYALAAILISSSLALLSVQLGQVPPFLLVGLALCIGGLCGLPRWRDWRVPKKTLLLGCYGLFGYHFCLFIALRYAPPLEANLINYLWPLLLVLLSPILLPPTKLEARHWIGGFLGLAGCVLVVLGKSSLSLQGQHGLGYLLAALAAVMWASYSLLTRRVPPFPTGAIGGFCLASGLLSLLAHALLEPAYTLSAGEWGRLALLGLGPMRASFFLWDAALKRGDARAIGTLAYLTPLLSTALLALFGAGQFAWQAAVALVLILSGAWMGRSRQQAA
ncbi:DMT family transporter [Chitinimonas sp. BJB300]|uniref:DMT family transporter n=1 Tax=Chitinimonas sp. BJB300 TaxID=1559339 RepID=UPI000C0FEC29|nr:DMT family transporter [Chitinimonas sp. BJB300]PHV12459.1 EamA family transporter [Chitinimonas sp. BJB300]TSJ88566.1 DMT family transporter [Chitinimonas sp. BJB300]